MRKNLKGLFRGNQELRQFTHRKFELRARCGSSSNGESPWHPPKICRIGKGNEEKTRGNKITGPELIPGAVGKEFPIRKENGEEGNTHTPIRFYPGTDLHLAKQSQEGKNHWKNQETATERTLQGRMEGKTIDAKKTKGQATDIFSKNRTANPEKEEGTRMYTHHNGGQRRIRRSQEAGLNMDPERTQENKLLKEWRNKTFVN